MSSVNPLGPHNGAYGAYTEEPEEGAPPFHPTTADSPQAGHAAEASTSQPAGVHPEQAESLERYSRRQLADDPGGEQPAAALPSYSLEAGVAERPTRRELDAYGLDSAIPQDSQTQRVLAARSREQSRERGSVSGRRQGTAETGTSRQSSVSTTDPPPPDYRRNAPRGHRAPASRSTGDLRGEVRNQRSFISLRNRSQTTFTPDPSAPPVPPVPTSFRQGTTEAAATADRETGETPVAESSTQARASRFQLGKFLAHPGSRGARTDSKLRDSISAGDVKEVRHYLDKGGDPAAPSDGHKQNGFHKLAGIRDQNPETTAEMMNLMLAKVPETSRGGAVTLPDRNKDTPLHIAQYKRGIAERRGQDPGLNAAQRLRHQRTARALGELATQMTTMSAPLGRHQLQNKEGKTPAEMYEIGRSNSQTARFEDSRLGRQVDIV
jgi:hypothetical protein